MNSEIPFKKNIIFKTKISEITDISLKHDYKVNDDMVEGTFYLSGTYKMTEASLINEDYYYEIPFSIALSDRIDKDTVNLKLESFDYKVSGDTLSLSVNLNLEADEISDRNILDSFNDFKEDLVSKLGLDKKDDEEESKKEELMEGPSQNETLEEKVELKETKEEFDNNIVNNLLSDINQNNSYITYKVHIVRDGESIQNIAEKYNVSIDNIKEYNDTEVINVGDKILVPFVYNE